MLFSLFDDLSAGHNTLYDLTRDYLYMWICGPSSYIRARLFGVFFLLGTSGVVNKVKSFVLFSIRSRISLKINPIILLLHQFSCYNRTAR